MSTDFQNWITILLLGIIGGSLIGLVMGHKLKEPGMRALSSPMIFQNGNTSKVLLIIGFILIGLAFCYGLLQGICAIVIGYITEAIVGTRISNNHNNAGYSTVIKTIIGMGLIVLLPITLWGYYSYNHAPTDTDKASFIYDCSDHAANEIFKGDSKGNTSQAKEVCGRLWLDMVGKYKSVGKINDNVRAGDNFGLYTEEVTKMYNTCVHETIYKD